MRKLDELLHAFPREATFHPINERSEHAWFPGNEACSLMLQCRYIWDDIEAVGRLRNSTKEDYSRKLLLKYLIIELRSLIEVIDRLRTHVMKAPTFDPARESLWRGLTIAEHQRARELFKEYSSAKLAVENDVISIRDNIGAHRGNVNWSQVASFWDKVSVETVKPLLDAIPRIFEFVKELNIYEWNRYHLDGAIEIIGGCIYQEDAARSQ